MANTEHLTDAQPPVGYNAAVENCFVKYERNQAPAQHRRLHTKQQHFHKLYIYRANNLIMFMYICIS